MKVSKITEREDHTACKYSSARYNIAKRSIVVLTMKELVETINVR